MFRCMLLLAAHATVGGGTRECGPQCQRNTLQDILSSLRDGAEEVAATKPDSSLIGTAGRGIDRAAPATRVVRGSRPHPTAPKLHIPNKQNFPDRNPASQLYAELMSQMQDAQTPTMAHLMATAVCHAQPRSAAAWQQLADVELQLSDPSAFSFLRANFIAAMLDDEEEWFEEGKERKRSKQRRKRADKKEREKGAAASASDASLQQAALRAQVWFDEGEYDKAKKHVKKALKGRTGIKFGNWIQAPESFQEQIDEQLVASHPLLERLTPSLVQWKASGSHSHPPMTHDPADAAEYPAIWQTGRKLPGEMRAAFVTPIHVTNLIDEGAVTTAFNTRLAETAIAGFESFLKTPPAFNKATGTLFDSTTLNDNFWISQKKTCLTSNVPDVDALMKHVVAGSARFLSEWGLPPADRLSDTYNSLMQSDSEKESNNDNGKHCKLNQPWFSIHSNNSDHVSHVHYAARLAVVYYPKVQKGDGRLVFEDPRGGGYDQFSAEDCNSKAKNAKCTASPLPFPPFCGNRHYHTPRSGDLVIFPGWLYHSVERAPTTAGEYRVSLSYNVDGNWQATIP